MAKDGDAPFLRCCQLCRDGGAESSSPIDVADGNRGSVGSGGLPGPVLRPLTLLFQLHRTTSDSEQAFPVVGSRLSVRVQK